MRTVVQRVSSASVAVGGKTISSIGPGLLVLVGITNSDTVKDADWMAKKVLNLRVFENDEGKMWDKSVMQKNFEVLVVSQFTLYGVTKGNKPDFHLSAKSDFSRPLYEDFVKKVKATYREDAIKEGQFGAKMDVSLVNDGPVTIELDSGVVPSSTPPSATKEDKH